jgi:uncharacterized protein YjiS (DUF1127 family)
MPNVKTIRFPYCGPARNLPGVILEHERPQPMSAHLGHASSLPTARTTLWSHGWSALLRRLVMMVETRMQLQELDDRMLQDIGLNRHDAAREAARAPWDIGPDGKPRPGF